MSAAAVAGSDSARSITTRRTRRPAPAHALEVAEQAGLLREALDQLSEKARLVFHLRAQEGLSFREIAGLVGTTEQGARQHMLQARTRLIRQLAEKS